MRTWRKKIKWVICIAALVSAFVGIPNAMAEQRAEVVVAGLKNPWSVVFLGNDRALITERDGQLRLFENGKLNPQAISGLPKIKARGQGGLMGLALHPQFEKNSTLCLSYVGADKNGSSTEVFCAELNGMQLDNGRTIFSAQPRSSRAKHFGGRLAFDEEGLLYVTLGDRGERPSAQNNAMHNGTLVRIKLDGSAPKSNPYIDSQGVRPEIYSTGHRNIQGIAIHPDSGEIWTHEHGPQGGDEVNIARAGKNYGWPIITYGVNYGFGTKIGEGTSKIGLEQPLHKWVPSIAPSGMAFYRGERYPQWHGDLFVGSLKFGELVRLEFEGEKLHKEHRYFGGEYGRIRDVATSPDGHLYFLTDARRGALMRLTVE